MQILKKNVNPPGSHALKWEDFRTIEKMENNRKSYNFNIFLSLTFLIDKTHQSTTSVQFSWELEHFDDSMRYSIFNNRKNGEQ